MPTHAETRARYERARQIRAARKARAAEERARFVATLERHKHIARHENALPAASSPLGRALPDEVRRAFPEAARHLENKRDRWVRPLETLRLVGKSPRAQLARVAAHLLARYPVPPCVRDVFTDAVAWEHAWFVDLGAGRSVREVTSGFKLSKRAAHLFRSAPAELGPAGGAWWAKLRAASVPDELAVRLARTRLFRGEASERFLEEVARYMVHQSPARRDLPALCAYLEGCWRENRAYSLKGKPLERLVREARLLYGDGVVDDHDPVFPPSGLAPHAEVHDGRGPQGYHVVELRSPHALRVEGARMHHCVYDYRHRCASGTVAIFSLRERWVRRAGRRFEKREQGVVTLEVWPRSRQLVQARERFNRVPDDARWSVIERFAALNGLKVTCRPRA